MWRHKPRNLCSCTTSAPIGVGPPEVKWIALSCHGSVWSSISSLSLTVAS